MFSISRFQVTTLKVPVSLKNFEGTLMEFNVGDKVNLLELKTALKESYYGIQSPKGLGVLPISLYPNFKLFCKGVGHA